MTDPYVRTVGRICDSDGMELIIGVDYDTVTLRYPNMPPFYFSSAEAEHFAQFFVAACWQAGQQLTRMAADPPPSSHDCREAVFTGLATEGHDCRDALFTGKD